MLKWEGGYVNHPKDPGGATNRGVTQARYDQYRKDYGLSTRHVKSLTEDELQAIYRKYYWDVVKGDNLPAGVDLAVFDFGVNSGPSRSIKFIQKIVGVKQDGVMGKETLAAIERFNPSNLVSTLCDNRMSFLRGLSTWSTFGKGWENRVKDIRKIALAMTDGTPAPTPSTNILEGLFKWILALFKS